MKVFITPRARRDLRQIHFYLQARSAQGAEHVMRQIRMAFLQIQDQPEIGTMIESAGVRRLYVGRYPYVAYYRLRGQKVEIIHVRHTSRAVPTSDNLA